MLKIGHASGPRRVLLALGTLALLLGCSGAEPEDVEDVSPTGEAAELESGEPAEVSEAETRPAKKRLSGAERIRQREAQQEFATGFALLWGTEGEHDKVRAHEHLLKAAELGHARSQSIVGVNYQKGRGCERDPKEGLRWLMLAAEGGWPHAQLKVGEAYRDGRGVEKDPIEALKWMALSARGGSIAGSMIAGSYAAALLPAQRYQGIQRARDWRIERGLSVKPLDDDQGGVRAVLEPAGSARKAPVEPPSGAPLPDDAQPDPAPPAAGA